MVHLQENIKYFPKKQRRTHRQSHYIQIHYKPAIIGHRKHQESNVGDKVNIHKMEILVVSYTVCKNRILKGVAMRLIFECLHYGIAQICGTNASILETLSSFSCPTQHGCVRSWSPGFGLCCAVPPAIYENKIESF